MDKLLKSDVNFQRVRDGRNALPFYFDLNLSTARSVAAGTHFIANVAGDSFYADANPVDGNCVVHFQDTNLDRAAVPFYVSPGFIANVPFTQLLIENAAQPGKKIRIAYGVDIDFQPGSVAQIAVSNSGGYTSIRPESPTGSWNSSAALALNTPQTVFLPAANTTGATLLAAGSALLGNVAIAGGCFVAKAGAAPASPNDGDVILSPTSTAGSANYLENSVLPIAQYIPPNFGLYFISSGPILVGMRYARWKV